MRFGTIKGIAVAVALGIVAFATYSLSRQRPQPLGAMLLSGLVGVAVGCAIPTLASLARRRAYYRAATGDDVAALRAAFADCVEVWAADDRRSVRGLLALHEASVLAREQRFREARVVLDRANADGVIDAATPASVAGIRAFILAHSGEESEALSLLDDVLAGAISEDERAGLLRTRGVVLQRLGRNEDAIVALSAPMVSGPRAATLFYLAEARRAVGRVDDAAAAYAEVAALRGAGPWQEAARDALSALQSGHAFR